MKYKVTYQLNSKIKTKVISYDELIEYKEKYDIIKIVKIESLTSKFFSYSPVKKDIRSLIDEINIMLQSNIKLDDAIHLLIKNTKKQYDKELLIDLKNGINKGENISKILVEREKEIGLMSIVFFKMAMENKDIKKTFDSFSSYLNNLHTIKQKVLKVIKYPLFLLGFFLITFIMIFELIVPKFKNLFLNMDVKLSYSSKALFFLSENYIWIFFTILTFIFSFYFIIRFFIKIKFVEFLDKLIFKRLKVIKYYNLYMMFLSIAILVENKYTFSQSLNLSKDVLNNTFINENIKDIIQSVEKGEEIYKSFEKTNIFDDIALRQLYIIQNTNNTTFQINSIKNFYYTKLNKQIDKNIAFIEPIFFLLIAILILWVISALFLPLWDITPN